MSHGPFSCAGLMQLSLNDPYRCSEIPVSFQMEIIDFTLLLNVSSKKFFHISPGATTELQIFPVAIEHGTMKETEFSCPFFYFFFIFIFLGGGALSRKRAIKNRRGLHVY